MFKKLVAIEPVNLVSQAEEELRGYAGEITLYEDVPSGDEEIIRRIGDADAVLVSYTSRISRYVIESCPYAGSSAEGYPKEIKIFFFLFLIDKSGFMEEGIYELDKFLWTCIYACYNDSKYNFCIHK